MRSFKMPYSLYACTYATINHEIRDVLFEMHEMGTLYSGDKTNRHHMLPQRMGEIFNDALGDDAIHKKQFMKTLSRIAHRRLHGGKGFNGKFPTQGRGKGGGMWNFLFRMFLEKHNDNPSSKQIDNFTKRLGEFFFPK